MTECPQPCNLNLKVRCVCGEEHHYDCIYSYTLARERSCYQYDKHPDPGIFERRCSYILSSMSSEVLCELLGLPDAEAFLELSFRYVYVVPAAYYLKSADLTYVPEVGI